MTLYTFFIEPFLQFLFMKRALVACIFLSISCAPMGVFLILKRMSLMGEALSHGILPGIAVAFLISGLSLVGMTIGGMTAGLIIAGLSTMISKKTILHEDASFSAIYILSLAGGVFLISLKSGTAHLMHLLFGNVLAITPDTLFYIASMTTITMGGLIAFYRPLVFYCFDGAYMRQKPQSESLINGLFICFVVINLVAACQALGTLMALGIMMIPAITARILFHDLTKIIISSIIIAVISSYIGLVLSFHFNVPSGPTIIIVCGVFYAVTLSYKAYSRFLENNMLNVNKPLKKD